MTSRAWKENRVLRRFFARNRYVCKRIESHLPQAKINIRHLYEQIVTRYMNSEAGQLVVDVGGGKSCPFAKHRDPAMGTSIVAVDISEEEMKYNTDVDEKRVTDIIQSLPFDAAEVDLLVSRSVLEHLESLESFIINSTQVLKSGGYIVHLFPSRFAPFALINQALPNSLSRRVLYFFIPESKGIGGYPAYYDNCYYSAIRKLLKQHGFDLVDVHLSYYQSPYFAFFVPLFVISAIYEILIRAIGAKNMAAYVLVVAQKKK